MVGWDLALTDGLTVGALEQQSNMWGLMEDAVIPVGSSGEKPDSEEQGDCRGLRESSWWTGPLTLHCPGYLLLGD